MTSPKQARLAYALLKMRQAQITAALKKIDRLVEQEPGDKNTAKIGDARFGVVSTTDPRNRATVVDPDLFTKFVEDVRPDEVVQVPTVREAFTRALLEHMDRTGHVHDWDGNEVPGVAFEQTQSPYRKFTPADGADELLGVLEPADLPSIDGVDLAGLLGLRAVDPAAEGGEGG